MTETILVPEQAARRSRQRSIIRFTKRDRATKKSGVSAERPNEKRREITQTDLEEYILLKRQLVEAREKFKKKHDEIQRLFESGCELEYGVHYLTIIRPKERLKVF